MKTVKVSDHVHELLSEKKDAEDHTSFDSVVRSMFLELEEGSRNE